MVFRGRIARTSRRDPQHPRIVRGRRGGASNLRYEVSAVLARAQSKGVTSAQDASEFLDDLGYLPIQVDHDALIFEDVHNVATAYRLTTYDAAYLELAQRWQVPIASLDAELIAACKLAGVALV